MDRGRMHSTEKEGICKRLKKGERQRIMEERKENACT